MHTYGAPFKQHRWLQHRRRCAEVAASLPSVGVVQLPREVAWYRQYLQECWLFDPSFGATVATTTGADKMRTQLYRQVAERANDREAFDGTCSCLHYGSFGLLSP